MPAILISTPYKIFTDSDGSPLKDGYIYIGLENLNPISNPISVYWDKDLTIPAAQPIRTINGYPSRNGSPGNIYVNNAYSIIINDKQQKLVFSSLNETGSASQGGVTYFATLAEAKSANVSVDDVVIIGDRATAKFKVISGILTANGFDIVAHDTLDLSYTLIEEYPGIRAWGIVGDGSDEQAAVNNWLSKIYEYRHTDDPIVITCSQLNILPHHKIDGGNRFQETSGDFNGNLTFKSPTTTDKMFVYQPASGAESALPHITGCKIVSNFPFQFNDETAPIVDGSGQPPLVGGKIEHNWCVALNGTSGNPGRGFTAAKMFDTSIQFNRFDNFRTWHIMLYGCDLNTVCHNRVNIISSKGIIEVQTGTFGSQNYIHHNDIVGIDVTNAIPFKSTARHINFQDNYIETVQKNGFVGTGRAVIDCSLDGLDPVTGLAYTGRIFSIVDKNNRLDTNATQMDFTRIYAGDFRHLDLEAIPSTGTPLAQSIFITDVDFYYNQTHPAKSINVKAHPELCPNINTEQSRNYKFTGVAYLDIENLRCVDYRNDTPNDLTLDVPNMAFKLANNNGINTINLVGYGAYIPSSNQEVNIYMVANSGIAGDQIDTLVGNDTDGTSVPVTHTLSFEYEKFLVRNCLAGDAFISKADSRILMRPKVANSGQVRVKSIIVEWV